ncbi:chemotaxis protein CheD [Gracilibacillus boraciitolerans JCM 21714]|uniref:Probable chemoreceptor glutamine deamidase CheD n=1 Tax=Gracilibacillus boraciitolerans JCM 21714 TaxID=1298598 RepID=W4VEH3_9BACI|nr:chemotaxis protein CheD [Gracilibacillus boraciitolerans]GAE91602.1 chemotaxis protein CheD [Gracilibacillus boraciitolerans JCM 21714]
MMLTATVVKVGIADLKVTKAPFTLKTSGLGSCVGVVIFDHNKVAGLAHVMLPDSTASNKNLINRMKYADTAIDMLVEQLVMEGAYKSKLKAKIAGGAHMFSFQSDNNLLKIGDRNVEAVKAKLAEYRIPLIAEDVRGNKGRTIEFNIETGMLEIRTVNSGVCQI